MTPLPPEVYVPVAIALCSTIAGLALAVRVLYADQRGDRREMVDMTREATAAMNESAAGSNRYAEAIDRLTGRLDRVS